MFPIFEFVSENTAFTIDESLLTAALVGRPAVTEFVQCSDDGSWIRIGEHQYSFSGVHQMAIVRAAFEAWQRGSPRIRTQPLLEEIGCRSKQVVRQRRSRMARRYRLWRRQRLAQGSRITAASTRFWLAHLTFI